jgi:hypothetical protein
VMAVDELSVMGAPFYPPMLYGRRWGRHVRGRSSGCGSRVT